MELEHYPTTRADDVAEAEHLGSRFRDQFKLDEGLRAVVDANLDVVARAKPRFPRDPAPNASSGGVAKVLHFIRHGQGVHNVLTDTWSELKAKGGKSHIACQALFGQDETRQGPAGPAYAPLLDAMLDAPLTERGVAEAEAARSQAIAVQALPELLVVSTMRRAAVTGLTAFPGVPAVAHDALHERSGLYVWDRRRNLQGLKADTLLSFVDWTLVTRDECPWWHQDRRETPAEMAERIVAFMRWLRDRPEKEIAIASHSALLFCLLQSGLFSLQSEALTCHGTRADGWFVTGEMRSFLVEWSHS